MSSILPLYCRATGSLDIEAAAGPPIGTPNQGAWTEGGALEVINNGTRHHASQGLPIGVLGRVVVSPGSPIAYYNQGIPYSATGNIVTGVGPITYYDQGVGFNAAGEIVTT